MNIAINAISAKLGGAVTYLQNLLPELQAQLRDHGSHRIIVWRGSAVTGNQEWPGGIEYREDPVTQATLTPAINPWRRLWFDQVRLPPLLRADRADVLFSTANFGPLKCPCPQILLVRNTVPFDRTYLRRVPAKVRAYYLFQRWLTLRCMAAADVVIFPSRAMLELVSTYTGGAQAHWRVAHYGTRHDLFYPAPERRRQPGEPVKLLHVSLYSDQKNLGTLLEALHLLQKPQPGQFQLRLTAGFHQDWLGSSPFFPSFRREQALYRQLQQAGAAEDVDWKAYGALPDLYRSSDIFVFPSYTESFGHPLVEAMASGLPIVAADVPVNRELCGEAAVYFPPFDATACGLAIQKVAEDGEIQQKLRSAARERAKRFTWQDNAARLVKAFKAARANHCGSQGERYEGAGSLPKDAKL
jgi:glycosyltransferase involved in cell wall biosynthesis